MILRFQLPHAALAVFYGVDRSTVTRAVHEIRPLLAARCFAVPGEAGLRPYTLADAFTHATAQGVELGLDGTEVRGRRPKAGCPWPGVRSCPATCGRTPRRPPSSPTDRAALCGPVRSSRAACMIRRRSRPRGSRPSSQYPQVKTKVYAGYRGVAKRFPTRSRRHRRSPPRTRRPRSHCLGGGPQEAVLGADKRRARQRRAQAVEVPPAAPRPPRVLHRDHSDHHQPRLRLHRRAVSTHQPTRQAHTLQAQLRPASKVLADFRK
ncbi:transposase family protein [Streptomyces sp. NPDC005318]|uniref:transposase family protein n=1 Tax=Streptomyces sp. NPDC005318 TaxID=3157031 RepID=UPI0033ACFA18